MPRALWSGSIAFGLVNAPVRMYPAVDEHTLEFRLVHVKDKAPIGYRKYCKKENKVVPDDEIAKAYELGKRSLVLLDDDDFARAEGESYRTIEILDFVPYEQIDPIYFERTYYLGPQDGAEKVYALLVRAMKESELAAIVRYVFHDRERLGCLRVREGVLAIERMYFSDEIRPVKGIGPKSGVRVDEQELELAQALIERITGDFDPSKYEDRYRKRLLQVIRRKRKGRDVAPEPVEEREATPDLLEALRDSVTRAQGGGNGRAGSDRGGTARNGKDGRGSDGLGSLTVKELNEQAKKLGVEGRSKMSKRQLVSAIERAKR